MSERTAVNLDDLRIEEPTRSSGGRKVLVIVLVLLIPAAFVLGWILRGGSAGGVLGGAIPVRAETVRPTENVGATNAGGFADGGWIEVPSYHPIRVSALTSGRIEQLLVLEGSPVEENQVVARIYDRDHRDAERQASAAVDEAQASLDLMLAGYRTEDVEQARAEVERLAEEASLAGKVLDRTRGLVPEGAASDEELDRDAAAVEVARARLASARQELSRFEAGFRKEEIAKARATLARAVAEKDLASARLSYCEVRSPVKGVVLQRHVTVGTWLPASNPLVVSLYDPTDLQVRIDVRQENAGRIRIGQKVEITTEAEPDRTYHGSVIRVEPLADFKKNTIQAKVRIEDPGPRLHPEMICRARFLRDEEESGKAPEPVPSVSSACIVRDAGRAFVFRIRGDVAVRSEVRLGTERDGRVIVESGLSIGDRVVAAPPPDLSDGTQVKVVSR